MKKIGKTVFASMVLLLFGTAFVVAGDHPGTESGSGDLAPPSWVKDVRTPLQDQIHAARMAGDMDRVRELEKQIPTRNQGGETGNTFFVPKCTTIGGPGDPTLAYGGGPQHQSILSKLSTNFGQETHVRSTNPTSTENNQSMAVDRDGNLYIAWQDNYLSYDYIQFYWSQDFGMTWTALGYTSNNSAHLKWPSIAIGEGSQDSLVLAYIVDDGVNPAYVEVAVTPLGTWSPTFSNPPIVSFWEGYAKPVIWTDSVDFSSWYTYLTAEGIYDSSVKNINICAWRSMDYTATWSAQDTILGNTDVFEWIDPDGTYGTTMNRSFVGCFNGTDSTLYAMASDDFGATYNPEVVVNTLSSLPTSQAVNPEFAAAINDDHVMCCMTFYAAGQDEVGQCYSKDAGANWSTLWLLEGAGNTLRITPELIAGENGKTWHMVYTSGAKLYYNWRPQDLSDFWQSTPKLVNGTGSVGHGHPKKGLACNFDTDYPCACWADFRDGAPDYDTYFTYGGSLVGSNYVISESVGGVSDLLLDAGVSNAYRNYIILGSVSGTTPGIPLPGGMATLPVNWDFFTTITINLINTPVFSKFMGTLDQNGVSKAQFKTAPIPGASGLTMNFAFALNAPWNYVSNPIGVHIVP